jgi:hypothetical protein
LQVRVAVEPQCKARVRFDEQTFFILPVANLGTEGCCVRVPTQLVPGLREKLPLEGLELVHPSLPHTSVKAKVVWTQGQGDPATGLVPAGVRFTGAPAGFTRDLSAFVQACTQYDHLTSDLDGLPS